jgi:hypothetical protein
MPDLHARAYAETEDKNQHKVTTIERRRAMTTRQLQNQAYKEWNCSQDIKRSYHTFEYYWVERYARVYQLPARIRSAGRFNH